MSDIQKNQEPPTATELLTTIDTLGRLDAGNLEVIFALTKLTIDKYGGYQDPIATDRVRPELRTRPVLHNKPGVLGKDTREALSYGHNATGEFVCFELFIKGAWTTWDDGIFIPNFKITKPEFLLVDREDKLINAGSGDQSLYADTKGILNNLRNQVTQLQALSERS